MQNVINRIGWVLAGLVSLLVIAAVTGIVRGGPLDPPGPPVSTMHTLDDTAPVWDQKLDSTNGSPGVLGGTPAGCDSDRFKCVMTYAQCASFCITVYPAVLDRETGLVWERAPSPSTNTWAGATFVCQLANTGARHGWRLPTLAELGSLKDQSITSGPELPSGNPFAISFPEVVNSGFVWTSTDDLQSPTLAYIEFIKAGFFPVSVEFDKSTALRVWCVRGPTSNR